MMKSGMNLSSLFFIVKLSIILNLFNNISDNAGNTNVVTKTTARLMSMRMNEISHIPETINIKNIHVGNKTGWNITDMN